MSRTSVCTFAWLLAIIVSAHEAHSEIVTYNFQATNDQQFFVFDNGDTVSGWFSYDNTDTSGAAADPSGNSSILSEQNAPAARLHIVYTDVSHGRTAVGYSDASPNSTPDLQVETSVSGATRFEFRNIITEPNNAAYAFGITFEEVLIRFYGYSPELPTDLDGLTPSFATMRIGVSTTTAGPNFPLDYVIEAPEPTTLAIALLGCLCVAFIRRSFSRTTCQSR